MTDPAIEPVANSGGRHPVTTPCIGTCTLNSTRTHCIGCARTLIEIARWADASDDWRRAVMADLPARRAAGLIP